MWAVKVVQPLNPDSVLGYEPTFFGRYGIFFSVLPYVLATGIQVRGCLSGCVQGVPGMHQHAVMHAAAHACCCAQEADIRTALIVATVVAGVIVAGGMILYFAAFRRIPLYLLDSAILVRCPHSH